MSEKKRAVAFGFFDGVHVGHAALMNKIKERAGELGAIPTVVTFDVHPDNLVFGKEVPLINSSLAREEIIKQYHGIENVVFIHFNKTVMRMPWKEFIDSIIEELNIGWIVVGHDFSFGYKGAGKAHILKEYCESIGIGCDIIEPVMIDGRVVSSTYIRTLLEEGDMEQAAKYLGHPHLLTDIVRSGYHLGTKMGTPTINMVFPEGVLIPKHGVYASRVWVEDGNEYTAVTNIGIRPTVGEGNRVNVETHILDFSGNLYGKQCRVDFYKYIRGEKKFDSFDELSKQIKRDAEVAREYFKKQ